uniref:Uncharacterized protein n=1 Tax=Aegilops tauschii subsp. strangulata TaxID=200361 RepID=A0A453FZD6_AEGTS
MHDSVFSVQVRLPSAPRALHNLSPHASLTLEHFNTYVSPSKRAHPWRTYGATSPR